FSLLSHRSLCLSSLFLSTHPATTALYTLSLHDALPISTVPRDRNGEAHPGWRRGSQPWMAKNTTGCLSRHVIDLYRRPRLLSGRSEEHTSELQSRFDLVCRLLLEKKKKINKYRSCLCYL